MVEASSVATSIKLSRDLFDPESVLGFQPDYFECVMCMEMQLDILECPVCQQKACQACLKGYTDIKHKGPRDQDNYTCSLCNKLYRMRLPNKRMVLLLKNVFKFGCDQCNRFWSFDVFQSHRMKGFCKKDDTASNNIAAIKSHRPVVVAAPKVEPILVAQQEPVQPPTNLQLTSLYICEYNTKSVVQYNLARNTLSRHTVNMESNFPHNFQYIQTPSQRLFLIGGGPYDRPTDRSLIQCIEILNNGTNNFDALSKDSLKFPRHGHSVTCLRDKFLVVTGSRLQAEGADRSVENYNIDMDLWFDMPQLNFGRYYHSSCTLQDKFVYVFAGINSQTTKYFNSIERFDSMAKGDQKIWFVINVSTDLFSARQGVGSAQISANEILVFGGFGGDYLKDCYVLKHNEVQLIKIDKETPTKVFAYQMPSIFDPVSRCILTADWKDKKILMFDKDHKWSILKDI